MAQSKELTDFYRAYLAWIEAGALEREAVFSRHVGLCTNLELYQDQQYSYRFGEELKQQFQDAGLSCSYPFVGYHEYVLDVDKATAYLNPKRIAWVRSHVDG